MFLQVIAVFVCIVISLFKAIMTWKVLSMVAVASIAALLHYEMEEDILYVAKEVVVPVTRAKAFLFIADMSNYRRVCLHAKLISYYLCQTDVSRNNCVVVSSSFLSVFEP